MKSKIEAMEKIKKELVNLKESPLYSYRVSKNYKVVVGEGNLNAKVMFVGEAPGLNEALEGRPFCGKAGRVLDELLKGINLKREEVYITNVVKDRPPDNRDPFDDEIELYGPYLDRQIEIISPKILVALGRISAKYLMKKLSLENFLAPISQIRGKIFLGKGFNDKEFYFMPVYHPAVAVYSASQKRFLEEDFKTLRDFLEGRFDKIEVLSYLNSKKNKGEPQNHQMNLI